jgi:hypothetical protein
MVSSAVCAAWDLLSEEMVMNESKAQHRLENSSGSMGTGKISAQNCGSWDATGQIIIYSHQHRHGTSVHDHPRLHAHPHHQQDDTTHEQRH